MSSGDLTLGEITFPVGSVINSVACAEVEAVDDSALESEETFAVFAMMRKSGGLCFRC